MQSAKNTRVLVVEDEALVGIMMEDFLGTLDIQSLDR